MNLEFLRGVSAYSLIHKCCPWKKVWVNYRMHCPACPLCSPGTPLHSFQVPFFLCSSYPQLSGILWPIHGWFLFSISFVGSLWGVILCSLQGVIVLLFFQDLLFGNFPFHLVTWKWMFVQLAFPFHCCCFYLSVKLQEKECRWGSRLSPSYSEDHSQRSFQRVEWKERLQVYRQTFWKVSSKVRSMDSWYTQA